MLLVILTCLSSDGHGLNSGGVTGERWRHAFGRAAAVAIPLRALFEHPKNVVPRPCGQQTKITLQRATRKSNVITPRKYTASFMGLYIIRHDCPYIISLYKAFP